jgi:hypothetical protein
VRESIVDKGWLALRNLSDLMDQGFGVSTFQGRWRTSESTVTTDRFSSPFGISSPCPVTLDVLLLAEVGRRAAVTSTVVCRNDAQKDSQSEETGLGTVVPEDMRQLGSHPVVPTAM